MDITPVGGPSFFKMLSRHYRDLKAWVEDDQGVEVTYYEGGAAYQVLKVYDTKGRAVIFGCKDGLGNRTHFLVSDSAAQVELKVVPLETEAPDPVGFQAAWSESDQSGKP